ncbi:hypothetical protein GWI33_007856 [Rhynchophorus ferrugineus]|uniref:Uncharacterized protein n=1 Tax=Rhynchophorus ferrugineus TaxID=354439 RepID=A0A834MI00_RHYFE|nr:hypothetical protein GWI33_007856 [Rhynchophorus ferrugineus]
MLSWKREKSSRDRTVPTVGCKFDPSRSRPDEEVVRPFCNGAEDLNPCGIVDLRATGRFGYRPPANGCAGSEDVRVGSWSSSPRRRFTPSAIRDSPAPSARQHRHTDEAKYASRQSIYKLTREIRS